MDVQAVGNATSALGDRVGVVAVAGVVVVDLRVPLAETPDERRQRAKAVLVLGAPFEAGQGDDGVVEDEAVGSPC